MTSYAGVREVSRNPRVFSSEDGIRVDESINPELADHFRSIIMFDEILCELPDLEVVGQPTRLMSTFLNGIKRMPCAVQGIEG